ncbi:MAG: glycosyltransferase [Streptosporangiales bacterium]
MGSTDSMLQAAEPGLPPPPRAPHRAQVEIVIPVRNEDRDLVPGVRRLDACLRETFPFITRITIADNGSTDGTWAQALALAEELPSVSATRLERPGRGGALGPAPGAGPATPARWPASWRASPASGWPAPGPSLCSICCSAG